MDPPRLDYAPAPPRNLRRGILGFVVGYFIATLICWTLLWIVESEGPVWPLAAVLGPIWAVFKLHLGLPEKAELFLILVVGPALWGLYVSMMVKPLQSRWLLLFAIALVHAAALIG